MKPIKWETSKYSSNAKVGGMQLSIHSHVTRSHKTKWIALVYCSNISRHVEMKYGFLRKTIEKAQEDAVRLARELLLDIQTSLNAELENFGLEPGDEE